MNCGLRVAMPPARPLLVYDGDCHFCTLWIRRWQQLTGNAVDYLPAQDSRIAQQFPEISREQFGEAVQLIDVDGQVYSGAEAVFRALAHNPWWQWPLNLFVVFPLFARLSERAYRFVAGHRPRFSTLTRWGWGQHVEVPPYRLVRGLFLRALGLVYLVAFVSLWSQISGLIGHNGILPVDQFLPAEAEQCNAQGIGWERYHQLPTLCWFDSSNGFLNLQCAAGCVLAVLLMAGFAPAPCLFLLWLLYLSLVTVGGAFLGFQWDNLLLETGLLAIFFAPLKLLPTWIKKATSPRPSPTFGMAEREKTNPSNGCERCDVTPTSSCSHIPLWLLRSLLFKLMFSSGCVKLLSGDPTWRDLTALTYHYQTQPLPPWTAWYAQQLPVWFQKFSCAAMFGIEVGAPFLIFAPRRLRCIGAALLAGLQVLIMLTGNYTFFNWLTLALCLLLLDDFVLLRIIPGGWRGLFSPPTEPQTCLKFDESAGHSSITPLRWPRSVLIVVAVIYLCASGFRLAESLGRRLTPFASVMAQLEPFRSVNNYGLFAVMTTQRNEIVIEGSNDGEHWLPYEFKYKPGDVMRRPGFVAPFQPRLDWQMWFAALGSPRQNPWLFNFCIRLLQGEPEVLALLARNPFPDHSPHYIRAEFYNYRFTSMAERRTTGAWWERTLIGEYIAPVSLSNFR